MYKRQVYEGEEAPNGESISAAGYDANNGVVYGLEASGKLYRYSGINPQSGKLTGRTQVATCLLYTSFESTAEAGGGVGICILQRVQKR